MMRFDLLVGGGAREGRRRGRDTGERPCSRPGCPLPAEATLGYAYAQREAWIERLSDRRDPQAYDLCTSHADRTRPPYGWQLYDRRPAPPAVVAPTPVAAVIGAGRLDHHEAAGSEDHPSPVLEPGAVVSTLDRYA